MLFGEDPVVGIKDPRDYNYIKLLRFTLGSIGSWPKKELGEKCGKYGLALAATQMFLKSLGLVLTLWYIWSYSRILGFVEIGHSYITTLMSCVTLSRGFSLSLNRKYRNIMRKFITKMHVFHFKDDSEYAMKTHKRVHKISHIFTMVLNIQMCAGLLLFNVIPIYNNYTSGKYGKALLYNETYEFSLYYKLPFDVLSNRRGYIGVFVYNLYATYICSNYICTFDLLLSLIIFNICGHYKILEHNLLSFPKPATASCSIENNAWISVFTSAQLYSQTEMEEVSKKLKGCIDYHRLLVGFTEEISDVFGPMLFVYYIFHQIAGCLLLLECSQSETAAVMRYGLLTVILFQQLIQISVIIELVGTVTGLLKDAAYNVPWEHMDTSNRKLLIIFLMNVQEPLHINALGLAKIGVQPMASILKTSFSYFAFLRSVSD